MLHHLLIDAKRDIAAEPNNTNHDPVFKSPFLTIWGFFLETTLVFRLKRLLSKLQKIRLERSMEDFEKIKVEVNFIEGPKVEILDNHSQEYLVEMYEKMGDEWALVYANHEGHRPFTWFAYLRKFRTNWRIKVWGMEKDLPVLLYQHTYNESGKNILFRLDHDSYKVNLEWLKKAEEFSKKTSSFVLVESKFAERLRKDYKGSVTVIDKKADVYDFCLRNRIYASYEIGKHDIQSNMFDFWESKGIFENHAAYYDSWHHPSNWIRFKNEDIFDDIIGL